MLYHYCKHWGEIMEFIKRMKKREFIELSLKTFVGLALAFIAVILMEGMIYGIHLNAYMTKSTTSTSSSDKSIAYCIKDGKNDAGEDLYFVLFETDDVWSATQERYTEDKLDKLTAKEVVMHAPSAFKLTMTPIHYVVITIFVAAVGGYFTYRFIKLSKSYKEVEETYEKTGAIEITNI